MHVVAVGLLVATGLVLAACDGETSGGPETSGAAETEAASRTLAEPVSESRPRVRTFAVARVLDGDTIELRNGRRVRLVQVDAPETEPAECYGHDAAAVLSAILPRGTKVTLEADPRLDGVDRYGRLLRYVHRGEKNVNLVLARRGAASVWFYDGDRGKYASALLREAKKARKAGRGLWGACAGTILDPSRAVATGSAKKPAGPAFKPASAEPEAEPVSEQPAGCHPSYAGACLDPSAADYDCAGGSGNGPKYTGTVTVVGYDEYGLDADGDGLGCE